MNLTPMCFGEKFRGVLIKTQAHVKALSLAILACESNIVFLHLVFFARDASINAPRLYELYFLCCMMNGHRIDPGAFLCCQLFSATISTTGRTVIRGTITSIARFLGVELNHDDRVFRSERLDKAAF